MYRKLSSVLLAVSLFKLSGSPWIQRSLEAEDVFIPFPDTTKTQHWCPRVLCTLAHDSCPCTDLQSDSIAALGVLLLELEANRKASWVEEDEDLDSGEKSNSVRLARILHEWEDLISDDYRKVAEACLEFDRHVETLDHPRIVPDRKGLVVIYKRILEPLISHATRCFGKLGPLLKGIILFGRDNSLTTPLKFPPSRTADRNLFDDDDGIPEDKER